MRRTYLVILPLVAISAVVFVGCTKPPDYWVDAKAGQKKILVSFPPLYAITHAVAGDDAYVLSMLSTKGPHGYDYTTADLLKLNKADLLIQNGLGLDDTFVERLLRNHKNRTLATLDIGAVLKAKYRNTLLETEEHGHDHGHGNTEAEPGHDHKHGKYDPHIWLGPRQAIKMTQIIAAKLKEIDPDHAKNYDSRAEKFIKELQEIQVYGEKKFEKKHIHMVTMHDSFEYFARAFNLEIITSIQRIPGLDPDAATLAKLRQECIKEKVSVIAVEPQYRKAQAELLQESLKKGPDGVNIPVVTLDPLETADVAEGKLNPDPAYYLKKLRENIDTIDKAVP